RARRFSRTHSSKSASDLTVFVPGCYALAVMSVELYRRARRAEASAARAPDRRRLRLEFFRQALAEGFDSLKVRHAEGASGQESVRTYARLMDDVIHSLTRLAAADATSDGLAPTPLVIVALGGYRRDFAKFLETTLAERDQRYRKFGASPYIGEPNLKESAGGLRDVHTAMWLAEAKFGARSLRELADKGLITPREQSAADAALTFL